MFQGGFHLTIVDTQQRDKRMHPDLNKFRNTLWINQDAFTEHDVFYVLLDHEEVKRVRAFGEYSWM